LADLVVYIDISIIFFCRATSFSCFSHSEHLKQVTKKIRKKKKKKEKEKEKEKEKRSIA
jgi:hypothetical protein